MHDDDETEQPTAVDHGRRQAPGGAMLPGRTGERYRLAGQIGRGGMGEILSAIDTQIQREVAVKRMRERNPTEHALGRFFREAHIQGRLDHPAIVPVHELGVDDDGRPFFTMKKLTGTTLAQRLAQGYPRERLLRAFVDVCLAIEFAHARGVVHRDLKPQNIVLGEFGEVYVLDWGVAKLLADPADDTGTASAGDELTVDGTVVGTRAYMAPEQARAQRDIDGRADVFALGCVLFEILAGEALHGRDGGSADPRPAIRAPGRDIPPELDELCVAATRRDRAARIQTARELGDRVQRYLDGDRDLALRRDLARSHLDAARAAFARGDSEDDRRTAMREAGRALALDPKLAGAAELAGRLMLEPPRVRPPALQHVIDADDRETLQRMARAGALGYLGFLCFAPLVFAGGRLAGYVAALVVVLAINCYLLLAQRFYANLTTRAMLVIAGNGLLVVLLARLCSPFLITPSVAALAAMALIFSPTYRRPGAVAMLAVTLTCAVLAPWLAEALGLVAPTLQLAADGLVIHPPLLELSATGRVAVLVLYVMAIVGAAAWMAYENRRAERSIRDRLHLQAWHLRQLVDPA